MFTPCKSLVIFVPLMVHMDMLRISPDPRMTVARYVLQNDGEALKHFYRHANDDDEGEQKSSRAASLVSLKEKTGPVMKELRRRTSNGTPRFRGDDEFSPHQKTSKNGKASPSSSYDASKNFHKSNEFPLPSFAPHGLVSHFFRRYLSGVKRPIFLSEDETGLTNLQQEGLLHQRLLHELHHYQTMEQIILELMRRLSWHGDENTEEFMQFDKLLLLSRINSSQQRSDASETANTIQENTISSATSHDQTEESLSVAMSTDEEATALSTVYDRTLASNSRTSEPDVNHTYSDENSNEMSSLELASWQHDNFSSSDQATSSPSMELVTTIQQPPPIPSTLNESDENQQQQHEQLLNLENSQETTLSHHVTVLEATTQLPFASAEEAQSLQVPKGHLLQRSLDGLLTTPLDIVKIAAEDTEEPPVSVKSTTISEQLTAETVAMLSRSSPTYVSLKDDLELKQESHTEIQESHSVEKTSSGNEENHLGTNQTSEVQMEPNENQQQQQQQHARTSKKKTLQENGTQEIMESYTDDDSNTTTVNIYEEVATEYFSSNSEDVSVITLTDAATSTLNLSTLTVQTEVPLLSADLSNGSKIFKEPKAELNAFEAERPFGDDNIDKTLMVLQRPEDVLPTEPNLLTSESNASTVSGSTSLNSYLQKDPQKPELFEKSLDNDISTLLPRAPDSTSEEGSDSILQFEITSAMETENESPPLITTELPFDETPPEVGSSAGCPPPVKDFHLEKYIHSWHVYYHTRVFSLSEVQCLEVESNFTGNDSVRITVSYRRTGSDAVKTFQEEARVIWTPGHGQYTVMRPGHLNIENPVNIIDTDYETYSLVYHCNGREPEFQSAMLHTTEKTIPRNLEETLESKFQTLNLPFELHQLSKCNQ